jgi:hypothetical protein
VGGEIVIYQQYQKVSYRRFYRWILPSKEGLPVYAKALSIYRHFAPVLIGIVFLPSAGKHQLVVRNPLTQVIIMAFIIAIYSTTLAIGVWQQNQNDQKNQCKQG